MKTFSSLAILACLAYQVTSMPVATTSVAEKRDETLIRAATPQPGYGKLKREDAETLDPLYYFYFSKRGEAEAAAPLKEAETLDPLYYFYFSKREEAEAALDNIYGKREAMN